ncbi:hypothetical protein B484DRAFT_458201 [Ochromonadaceae sp. CCMP2298]|nr:hypothetical protein B484DRAFT_458201 [Ochromonadaceae sp. CCMP2298]
MPRRGRRLAPTARTASPSAHWSAGPGKRATGLVGNYPLFENLGNSLVGAPGGLAGVVGNSPRISCSRRSVGRGSAGGGCPGPSAIAETSAAACLRGQIKRGIVPRCCADPPTIPAGLCPLRPPDRAGRGGRAGRTVGSPAPWEGSARSVCVSWEIESSAPAPT